MSSVYITDSATMPIKQQQLTIFSWTVLFHPDLDLVSIDT